MSLPFCIASKFLNIEIFLFEPNMVIGRANKLFLNSCKKIFCYTKMIKNFPDNLRDKIIIINPLVRKEIYELKSSDDIQDKLTLLIIGGSQGANIFDKNLKNSIINISKKNQLK